MPRQFHIDTPGALHHIIARGIECRQIFDDDQDRYAFLERLALVLKETRTTCYAWALIPNHFYLLIRTGTAPVATVMRRLLTGHTQAYNRRHRRHGHRFQNRYKSILCQEDLYFLELVAMNAFWVTATLSIGFCRKAKSWLRDDMLSEHKALT